MARTLIDGGDDVQPGSLTRALLNTTTAGSAVIAKAIAGTGISLTSTGADAGTGDVTVSCASNLLSVVNYTAAGSGAAARTAASKLGDLLSVLDFGAVANAVTITGNCSITSGAAALTVSGAAFAAGDVGKAITLPGAGASGAALVTTISAYTSATQVTLAANASTTLSSSSQTVTYGTDNKTAIQNALNQGIASGQAVYIPAGRYYVSGALSASISTATETTQHFSLLGAGMAQSFLVFGYGNYNGLTLTGPGASGTTLQAYMNVEGFALEKAGGGGGDGLGVGLYLIQVAYSTFTRIKATGWADGCYTTDTLSNDFFQCNFRWNSNAGVFLTAETSYSYPNAISFFQCEISNNVNNGLAIINGANINVIGGAIEGNGVGSANTWAGGIYVSGGPLQGACGLNVIGTYFEAEQGYGDVMINVSDYSGTYNIIGCTFHRNSSSQYVNSNIYVNNNSSSVPINVNVRGNGFKRQGTYVASSSRPYVGFLNALATRFVIDPDNYFMDSVENIQPNGDHTQPSSYARVLARFLGSSSGVTNYNLKNVSSVVRNSVGNYTITYNQPLLGSNNIVHATVPDATGWVLLASESASAVTIARYNAAGVLTDGGVSLAVFGP